MNKDGCQRLSNLPVWHCQSQRVSCQYEIVESLIGLSMLINKECCYIVFMKILTTQRVRLKWGWKDLLTLILQDILILQPSPDFHHLHGENSLQPMLYSNPVLLNPWRGLCKCTLLEKDSASGKSHFILQQQPGEELQWRGGKGNTGTVENPDEKKLFVCVRNTWMKVSDLV